MSPPKLPSINGVAFEDLKPPDLYDALGISASQFDQAKATVLQLVDLQRIRLPDPERVVEETGIIQRLKAVFPGQLDTKDAGDVRTAVRSIVNSFRNNRSRSQRSQTAASAASATSVHGGASTLYSMNPPTTVAPFANAGLRQEKFEMPSIKETELEVEFTPTAALVPGDEAELDWFTCHIGMIKGSEQWSGENIDVSNLSFDKCKAGLVGQCHRGQNADDFRLFWTHPEEGEQECFDQPSLEAAILTLQTTLSPSADFIRLQLKHTSAVATKIAFGKTKAEVEVEAAARARRELEDAEKKQREVEDAARARRESEDAEKARRELEEQEKVKRRTEALAKKKREDERRAREKPATDQEAIEIKRRELEEAEKVKKASAAAASKPKVAGTTKVNPSATGGIELDPNTIDLTDDENEGGKRTGPERRPMPKLTIYDPEDMDDLCKNEPWVRALSTEVGQEILVRFRDRAQWMRERKYMWMGPPKEKEYVTGTMAARTLNATPNIVNAAYEEIASLTKKAEDLTLDDIGDDEDGDDEIAPSAGANLIKKHLVKLGRTDDELCEEAREFWKMKEDVWHMSQGGRTFVGLNDDVVLKNYQLLAIYILMKWGQGWESGGFLSDDMGLGKTIQALAVHFTQLLISDNFDEVAEDRRSENPRHLPKDEQDEHSRCTVEDSEEWEYPFACICREHAITFQTMNHHGGAGLVIAPHGITRAWYTEAITKFNLDVLNAYVRIAVNGKGDWTRFPTKRVQALSGEDAKYLRYSKNYPDCVHPEAHRRLVICNVSTWNSHIVDGPWIGHTMKAEQKYYNTFPDPYRPKKAVPELRDVVPRNMIKDKKVRLIFGSLTLDELHKCSKRDTNLMKQLPDFMASWAYFVWLSGTLIDNDLLVPVAALRVMQRKLTKGALQYPAGDFSTFGELAKKAERKFPPIKDVHFPTYMRHANILAKKTENDRLGTPNNTQKFRAKHKAAQLGLKEMLYAYVIRRTSATRWLDGKPAVFMPANYHYDVKLPLVLPGPQSPSINNTEDMRARRIQGLMDSVQTNKARARAKRDAEDGEEDDTPWKDPLKGRNPKSHFFARVASSFPALLDFFDVRDPAQPNVPMGAGVRKPIDWHMNLITPIHKADLKPKTFKNGMPDHSWIAEIKRWAEDSPKVAWTQQLIELLDQRAGGAGAHVMVFCGHIASATFLYVYLKYHLGWDGVCLVHAEVSEEQRSALVGAFQGYPPTDDQPPLKFPLVDNVRIIITTYELMGVGFTCTAANNTIMFEPATTPKEEKQASGRTCRTTQEEPVCYSYREYSEMSPVEADLIAHTHARSATSGQLVG
ncbi:hypothetical protein LTR97_001486 [Elasticomyces elasticus]|uniref:Helicase C-terminal domain-containing protein n=1 Tax=Elasticomyces elasticus TaxID=574655 RepID=A0AAN7WHL5_9PEZI|nr:hypothetical protein LTR97_001486 [Elasticomyces elasticus]